MNCYCGEKAFTFTKISCRDNKKNTCLVSRCNRTLEETNKKRKKCDFRHEKIVEISHLTDKKVKSFPNLVTKKTSKEDYVTELVNIINTIKMCQDTEHPFDKYTNRILYLSKILNIPPYIQEKYTIEEYYKIAMYFINNPKPVRKQIPSKNYSIVNDFLEYIKNREYSDESCNRSNNQELYEHFKNLLTIEKKFIKVKQSNRNRLKIVHDEKVWDFKTGAINDEDMVQEDELDIEEFDSGEEQDDYDGDYMSD